MATKQITTDLFSFKTFRSPDKLDYNDRNKSFIHHPNMSQSRFNNCPVPPPQLPAPLPKAPTKNTPTLLVALKQQIVTKKLGQCTRICTIILVC